MTTPPDTAPGLRLSVQMLRFAIIGTLGFFVDTATVYATHFALGVDLYSAGALAFLLGASFTWAMNRRFTFPEARTQARGPQWLRFLATQAVGFAVNRGTYAALIASLPLAREHPVLAVAAGSLAGMGVNFVTARQIAFRARSSGRVIG